MSSNDHAKKGRPYRKKADLPGSDLSDKQRKLCLLIAQGNNHTKAYRMAYDAEKMKSGTCSVNAYNELQKDHVKSYLADLQAKMLKAIDYTAEQHIRELEALAISAEASGNYGAATQARIHMGKALGLYTDKLSIKSEELAPEALISQIETIDPSTAKLISQALGLASTKH